MDNKANNLPDKITMMLIDTSAFHELNSDFIGLHSAVLPSFFSAAADKGISLLTHPILEKEIQKHIEDSSIFKDYQKLVTQLGKCKDVLLLAECNDVALFEKIAKFDIKAKTFETFAHTYSDAIRLDYPDPRLIFDQYFSMTPPFSASGKKKCEFPDAFVIESAKQYLAAHPNEVLLAVSKDGDWKAAFSGIEQVLFCETISEAIVVINKIESVLKESVIEEILQSAYNIMIDEIAFSAASENFDLPDYELESDFELDGIECVHISDVFVPLRISQSSLLVKTTAVLSVDGSCVVLDEDCSVWDREDECYIFTSYAELIITGGEAEVECEIELTFDHDDPTSTVHVSNVKINNRYSVNVVGGNVSLTPIDPEEDYYADVAETLEDSANHG